MHPTDAQPQWPVTLQGDCLALANLVCPVASLHQNSGRLGQHVDPLDGSGYLPGVLCIQTSLTIIVPSGDRCLEPGPLTAQVCFWMGVVFRI